MKMCGPFSIWKLDVIKDRISKRNTFLCREPLSELVLSLGADTLCNHIDHSMIAQDIWTLPGTSRSNSKGCSAKEANMGLFGKKFDVFISYKSKNVDLARQIADTLIFSGKSVWFNEYQVLLVERSRFRYEEFDEVLPSHSK